jgi:hypothetical protein
MNYQLHTNSISLGRASVISAKYSNGIKRPGRMAFQRIIGGPITCKLDTVPKKYHDVIQCVVPMNLLVSNTFVEICNYHSVKGIAFEKVEFIGKSMPWDYHLLIPTAFAEVDIHAYCGDNILLDEYGFVASFKDIFSKREVRLLSSLYRSIFCMSNIITEEIFCTSDVAELLESHNLTNLRVDPH